MAATGLDARLGRRLVLDEIFDLSLYRGLHAVAPPDLRRTLEALIPVETRHVAFWQKFFGLEHVTRLDAGRRLRLALFIAAGAYIGAGSEAELRETEDARRRFLGEIVTSEAAESPLGAAAVVGIGYFVGAVVPVLPVVFGARTVLPTVVTGGAMIIAVSAIVAFISGMNVRRRIALNVVITGLAVIVTYVLGLLTKKL